MATSTVTVLKIGGASGKSVLDTFAWYKRRQKKDRDPEADCSTFHWSPSCRRQMDAFAEALRAQSTELPIVFCAEYVDMWSLPASPRWMLPAWQRHAITLYADSFLLECYALPDRGRLQRDLKSAFRRKRIRERNPQEDRWALVILQEALLAWEPLVKEAALVWLERSITASVEDEALVQSLGKVPKWLKRREKTC